MFIAVGVLLEVIGLVLDIALHSSGLAGHGEEGLFALTNPGHLVFGVGLVCTVAGVGRHLARRSRWRGPLAVGGAAGAIAAVVGVQYLPALGPSTHRNEPTLAAWQGAERALANTRQATEQFETLDAAIAAGYVQWTSNEEGQGEHWINLPLLRAGRFDLKRPAGLVYAVDADGDRELAGVAWLLPRTGHAAPPSEFDGLGTWHNHHQSGLGCQRPVGDLLRTRHVPPEDCNGADEVFVGRSPWILHAWIFRPAPEGMFSDTNASLPAGGSSLF